jgi:toxin FitB
LNYVIDTNVISEIRKGSHCDPVVAHWWAGISEDQLYLSALVVGEIREGVELARARDPQKAAVLERWLGEVTGAFGDRIMPVSTDVAEEWGRMNAIRPVPVINALLAATAKVNGFTLVTRNEADVAGLGAEVLNPFKPT